MTTDHDSFLLQKALAEKSLRHFVKMGWPAIESYEFVSNWHLDAICEHLTGINDRKLLRLLINLPPRHAKSIIASVFWPAWTWAQNPDPNEVGHTFNVAPGTWRGPGVRWLSASYAYALSVRDAGNSKRLIQSPWYQERWADRFAIRQDASANDNFANDKNGTRLSVSIEGQLTGQGGDIIIVDDPHNVQEGESPTKREKVVQWWQESLPSRLNDQNHGAMVVIMQRVHALDMAGHIIANEMGAAYVGDPSTKTTHVVKWDHLCLPARFEHDHPTPVRSSLGFKDPRTIDGEPLWKARFDSEALDNLSAPMTQYAIAGQLQQRPSPRDGGMFKRSWFSGKIVGAAPSALIRIRRWDLAASEVAKNDPDWTVGVLMSRAINGLFYIEDIVRLRGSIYEVEKTIKTTATLDGRHVSIRLPQDPGGAGKGQLSYLVNKLAGFTAHGRVETGSKETRASPFAAQCEAGNVYLVKAPWNAAFMEELEGFPNAAHDDQVDAASGAFAALIESNTGTLTGRYGYAGRRR